MSPAANRPRRGALPVVMRLLLGLGFLLAIAAIGVAVFSEEVRWLKLAVLLGVWAALTTAFPVAYLRRTARTAEQKTEESKRTYELELHREISARREYEIGVSEAAREEAESRHREELASLREQLDRLNTTLSGLLDGDLLFERLTLSAESTRVRQVGGESGRGRLAAMARPGQIEAAVEPTGPYLGHQPAAPTPMPPPQPHSMPPRSQPGGPGFGGSYPTREEDTVQFARPSFEVPTPPVAEPAAQPVAEPVGVEDAGTPSAPAAAPESVLVAEPVAAPEPEDVPEPVVEPEPDDVSEPVVMPEPVVEPEPVPEPEDVLEPVAVPEPDDLPETVVEPDPEVVPEPVVVTEPAPQPLPLVEAEPEAAAPAEPASETFTQPEPEPAISDGSRRRRGSHSVDPDLDPDLLGPADPEPPAIAEPDLVAAAEPESGTGHSEGISVADLLAAYGAADGAPRRRRRAED